MALVTGTPGVAATQIAVLTTANGEFQPARSDTGLAWEQNTPARPRHYDVMYKPDDGSVVQANRPGTGAAMGDISGSRVIYQQYRRSPYTRRGRSDLYFYDVASGDRSKVPGVNTRLWEYWPSISEPWVLFARHKVAKKEIRWLFLRNLDTGEQIRLDRTKGKKAFIGPGQVNGNHAVWYTCNPVCNVFRYDIGDRSEQMISNPGFYQRAPSVTPGGTVYFSRGGKRCGASVSLVREAPDGSQESLFDVQTGLDIRDTYVYVAPSGVTEVYYERNACGAEAGSDIYKILDPDLAGLNVTLSGTGTGTVTSTPTGINCGSDCAHDYPGGTTVTLQAQAGPDSYFAGWSGPCTGTGGCSLELDTARSVTATFEKSGSITITKVALPGDPQDFAFTATGLTPSSFSLDDDIDATLPKQRQFSPLVAGTYTVRESGPPSDWQLAALTCTGGGPDTTAGGGLATIGLDPGEVVVCTFTNAKDGSITIRKDAVPDHPQDFEFDPSNNLQLTNFQLDDDPDDPTRPNEVTFGNRPVPATYIVQEVNIAAGWQLTGIECTGGGENTTTGDATATIGLDPGEAVVCTFTNGHGS
jgi:hypothetical protein